MIKLYSSIVEEELINDFRDEYNLLTYLNVVGNLLPREFFISVSAVLSPNFIEIENCIFWVSDKKNALNVKINDRYNKVENEKYHNIFTVGQLFSLWTQKWLEDHKLTDERDEKDYLLSMEVAKIIKYFWSLKLKEDFPDREFIFEIGDGTEDFYSEYGVCITFYEKT